MKRRSLVFGLLILVTFAIVVSVGEIWRMRQQGPEDVSQGIAIPSYFRDDSLWSQLGDATPIVGLAIVNPHNGLGTDVNDVYLAQVQQSQAKGIKVLGYIATDHGKRNVDGIHQEVDGYVSLYHVDGVFFDQASVDCAQVSYYRGLSGYVRSKGKDTLVVLNPGTITNECYMAAADVIVTFENTYQTYVENYQAPMWTNKYNAHRFWHLIYDTPTTEEMQHAVTLSKERRAGWVYVTPAAMPNPWDELPDESYWRAEITALQST